MSQIFGLIKFIFNTALFLAGAVGLLMLFAHFSNNPFYPAANQLTISTGSAWPFPPLSSEARALYNTLQERVAEINSPLSSDSSLASFIIAEGETAQQVAQQLQSQGFIGDAELFVQLLRYNGLDTQLQAGAYELRRTMSMREIGAALYWGRSARLSVTVPPGWRMEQVAEHVAAQGLMGGNLFLQQAQQGVLVKHPLLADRPAGQSYEGYLFPGTYPLPEQPTPTDLIAQMLNQMSFQLPAEVTRLARQRGLTFHQLLTLASIVERETHLDEERPLIASVYLNRLKRGSSLPYLQADPTVQYAMGYQAATGQWWKTPVTLEEYKEVNSPYNTYLYPGLPPGPIASPGLASIMAMLQPAETNYLFFVCAQPNCEGGQHTFAVSYEEHLQNVAVYMGQ
ncbi:MAG: endolytic transglycosylase MltG [Anaerolineae bacterium]